MKPCITANKYRIAATVLVLGLWWGMSKLYSPLVVPPIHMVAAKVVEILRSAKLWAEIGKTLVRLASGLGNRKSGSDVSQVCLAVCCARSGNWFSRCLVSSGGAAHFWLILAIIWFGFNGRASIFIVVMAVVPTMFICISDGIAAIDRKLMEMGAVFGFAVWKKLRYILLPSVAPYFISGLKLRWVWPARL